MVDNEFRIYFLKNMFKHILDRKVMIISNYRNICCNINLSNLIKSFKEEMLYLRETVFFSIFGIILIPENDRENDRHFVDFLRLIQS